MLKLTLLLVSRLVASSRHRITKIEQCRRKKGTQCFRKKWRLLYQIAGNLDLLLEIIQEVYFQIWGVYLPGQVKIWSVFITATIIWLLMLAKQRMEKTKR